jgi:serine/threonine protein kinase
MVLAIDDQRVAKIDTGSSRSLEDIKTEREIYRKLSSPGSPFVLRCYEIDNPNGLVLERCKDTIRKRLQSRYNGKNPPEQLARKWAFEAAQGLAYVHRCGVIQGDGSSSAHARCCIVLT